MNLKKIIRTTACTALICACSQNDGHFWQNNEIEGELSVSVRYDDAMTKGTTEYITALEEEKAVKKVEVLVFDKQTGALNSFKSLNNIDEDCNFTLPTGEKVIYAVLNGPDMGKITNLTMMDQLIDDLSIKNMGTDGLTLVGSTGCNVVKGVEAEPVIKVRWLVARVVLQKITCNIPAQYGSMHIDCAYLGNANTKQYFSGSSSGMVNIDGYEGSNPSRPIGKDDIEGSCPEYLFRNIGTDISAGSSNDRKFHMYCHPNSTDKHTCLYLLTTIGDHQYYYRVPLDQGLIANSTCSVELKITNLGSLTPPEGDYESNSITARISIEGWTAGNSYTAEF